MALTPTPFSPGHAHSRNLALSEPNNPVSSPLHSANPAESDARQSNRPFLMPRTTTKGRRTAEEGYWPKVSRTKGHRPACLVNASVTYCGEDRIYAFGGFDQYTDEVYNHVLKLDLKTLQWNLVNNYGDIPGVRMGHTATLYQGDKLLIYGGENEHRTFLSDMVIFDVNTAHWVQPPVSGPIPKGRARHAAALYQDKLFIVGGVTGPNNTVLNDVCYLDLKSWTWSKTWTFIGRFDHTAWVSGDRLWVFGGLGEDMDRGSEIWWMDLKGDGALDSTSIPSEKSNSSGRSVNPHHQSQHPAAGTGYAANSSSIQSNPPSSIRRTYAPASHGAISSTNFVLNPGIPSQACGTHFHFHSSGVLLDFATPASTIRPPDCSLSALRLDSLRWQKLAQGVQMFSPGYRWHYCAVDENGTKAWLLGCATDLQNGPDGNIEEYLCDLLPIDLTKFGIMGNASSLAQGVGSSSDPAAKPQPLGVDLGHIFDKNGEAGGEGDFIITAERDDNESQEEEASEEGIQLGSAQGQQLALRESQGLLAVTSSTSLAIHVHKCILVARWPHFGRLYGARMIEYHSKRMHIPEPYSVVRAFLYYLYSDSIAQHPEYCPSLNEVAGLLVMANLYDMPSLHGKCVSRLLNEMDVDNAAVVWERAGVANAHGLRRRAAAFCLKNWGRIVRTLAFRKLSRPDLMELCEEVDSEGQVVQGADLDGVGAPHSGQLGSGNSRRAPKSFYANGRIQLGEEMNEDDMDEDEGMDMN
ncbi:MAG: hypothetical protein M1833_003719 [Piccolia ochrophora]|nr:MAG: hypothetical protein M1833_003719 [Piccolia ochrophora]